MSFLPILEDVITNGDRLYNVMASGINALIGESAVSLGPDIGEDTFNKIRDLIKNIFTSETIVEFMLSLFDEDNIEHISDDVRKGVETFFDNALAEEAAETLGQIVMGPVVALFERYAEDEGDPIEDFAATFHGLMVLLTIPEMLANLLQGHAVSIYLGRVGGAFKSIYWSLGLGFLGWQTLAPLLSNGLQPRLGRHYKAKFRPERFSLNDLIYLAALGERSDDDIRQEIQEQGWREKDIDAVLNLSFRSLSRSEIGTFLKDGVISEKEAVLELTRQLYNPKYIPAILQDIQEQDTPKDRTASVSRIRKAFKEGLRTRQEFIEYMRLIGYDRRAIELEIDLVLHELEEEQRRLTQAQIKAAFVSNVLSEVETRNWFRREGYDTQDIRVIMETWKAEKQPPILRLNRSTIVSYFKKGVIGEGKAQELLFDLGWDNEQVSLIMQDAKLNASGGVKQLTVGYLIQARAIGALNQGEFNARLQSIGVPIEDNRIYEAIAIYNPVADLNLIDIEQGYKNGVISLARTRELLGGLGVATDVITLRLNTWTEQKARLIPKVSPGLLITFYQKQAISKDELTRGLGRFGYTDADIAIVLKGADGLLERVPTPNDVRLFYTTETITKDKALSLLELGGFTRENALNFTDSWDTVLASNRPTPSITQLMGAVRDGVITRQEFIEAMRDKKYTNDSINFYLARLDQPEITITRNLTKADIVGLYADTLLGYNESLERLIGLGYSPEDAELLLARKEIRIEDTQAHALFMAGYIAPELYIDVLIDLGFTMEHIEDYLTRLGF